MSAWVVSKAHIDAMITAGLKNGGHYGSNMRWYFRDNGVGELLIDNASEVGQMLWNENLKSIHGRYPDTLEGGPVPGPIDFEESDVVTYRYDDRLWMSGRKIDPVAMLKAISCYEYQSCEHREWPDSEAFAFCKVLEASIINMLPGYKDAKWGVDDASQVLAS
jgi:hypothetical protein